MKKRTSRVGTSSRLMSRLIIRSYMRFTLHPFHLFRDPLPRQAQPCLGLFPNPICPLTIDNRVWGVPYQSIHGVVLRNSIVNVHVSAAGSSLTLALGESRTWDLFPRATKVPELHFIDDSESTTGLAPRTFLGQAYTTKQEPGTSVYYKSHKWCYKSKPGSKKRSKSSSTPKLIIEALDYKQDHKQGMGRKIK